MNRNDIYWKGLIEELFPYFIPFFLPQFSHLFSLTQPVAFLDKELDDLFPNPADEQNVRYVDKLVRIATPSGEEKWVLIHIEVQGYADPHFAQRMFTYFYRILDRYNKPITAIAIFTDNSPSFCPSQYVYDFAGTRLPFSFNTYKVLQQQEADLEKSDNPFAVAILTVLLALKRKKRDDENLLRLKVALGKKMYAKGFSPQTTRHLFNFIRQYVRFASRETAIQFDNAINLITNNTKPMGLEEQILEIGRKEARRDGKAEGKMEGKAEQKSESDMLFVNNLLLHTDFSDEKIAMLAGVDVAFIHEVKKNL